MMIGVGRGIGVLDRGGDRRAVLGVNVDRDLLHSCAKVRPWIEMWWVSQSKNGCIRREESWFLKGKEWFWGFLVTFTFFELLHDVFSITG